MNFAVIGSRGFNNYPLFKKEMDFILSKIHIDSFVSGGAKSGADNLMVRQKELLTHLK